MWRGKVRRHVGHEAREARDQLGHETREAQKK